VLLEDKPAVRKAAGVYYTPGYIVDYIVKHTVGKHLEGRAPRHAAELKILDPACGSGSFLIGAYRYLLQWHREWYERHGPERYAGGRPPRLCRGPAGAWRLTTAERKRILLGSIYGVDIDPQAVEVTRLTLLWKALENEPRQTLGAHLRLLDEPAWSGLTGNIKCGNALLGPDSHKEPAAGLRAEGRVGRAKAFDWNAEFPEILQKRDGGFSAVIGNPPYRRELGYKQLLDEVAVTEFGRKYRSARMDLWYYFVHRGLELLKRGGFLSFIVNAYWITGTGARRLVQTLRDTTHLDEVFFLGKLRVFPGVSGRHMIIRVAKSSAGATTRIKLVRPRSETEARPFVLGTSPVRVFEKTHRQLFRAGGIDLQPPADKVLSKLECHSPLTELGIVRQGIAENPASINKRTNGKYGNRWQTGEGVFVLRPEEIEELALPRAERKLLRPYHALCDIGRYRLAPQPSLVLIYSTRQTCPDIRPYPGIRRHLGRFRQIMEDRRETRKGANRWWHLHWPRDERLWRSSKILSVQMAARPSFVPSRGPAYVPFSINVFVPAEATQEHMDFICGLLNSRLMWKWYQHRAKMRGVGIEINGRVLGRTPIRRIDFFDPAQKARHDRIVELVRRILSLENQLKPAENTHRKTLIQHEIDAADREIDRLVYGLYGLTDAEIADVEESTGWYRDRPWQGR
jgi:hypothetical protein